MVKLNAEQIPILSSYSVGLYTNTPGDLDFIGLLISIIHNKTGKVESDLYCSTAFKIYLDGLSPCTHVVIFDMISSLFILN